MSVCIVTSGHLASNPRVVKEATALAQAGYRVHVVHGHYAPWAAPFDARLIDGFTTTSVPFGPHLASPAMRWRQGIQHRVASTLARLSPSAQFTDTAAAPIAQSLARATSRIPARLYIAHYTAALPAAARAAGGSGAAYAFDAEDFHPGDLPDEPRNAGKNRIIRAVESRYLPDACFVTAAAPGIADAYSQSYGIDRPEVVLNAFPLSQAPDSSTPEGSAAPGPSLYWFSQTIGPSRGIECAIRATAIARARPHLYLRGTPSPGFKDILISLAEELGVAGRLHFLPVDAPDRMVELAARYDVGLSGEPGFSRNNSIALGNKLFTYLLAGLPAVVSDVPSHLGFAAETIGATFPYRRDDPSDLARIVDELLSRPERLARARASAYALGQNRFNWDTEKEKTLRMVAGVIGDPD